MTIESTNVAFAPALVTLSATTTPSPIMALHARSLQTPPVRNNTLVSNAAQKALGGIQTNVAQGNTLPSRFVLWVG